MHIFVKNLTGKTITVDVEKTDRIKIAKSASSLHWIPISDQSLMYARKQLEDDRTLADYNIENESTLYLLLRWGGSGRGGLPNVVPAQLNVSQSYKRKCSHSNQLRKKRQSFDQVKNASQELGKAIKAQYTAFCFICSLLL
ncbi:ubiquitin-ribosomal protein eL40 fusion protein-like [Carex rostrata]